MTLEESDFHLWRDTRPKDNEPWCPEPPEYDEEDDEEDEPDYWRCAGCEREFYKSSPHETHHWFGTQKLCPECAKGYREDEEEEERLNAETLSP